MEALAAKQDVEEVGCRRIVLIPLRDRHLHLVVGVLDVSELDIGGDRLDVGLIAEFGQNALQINADRLRNGLVFGDDRHLLALGARFLDQLLGLRHVRCRPFGSRVLGEGAIRLMPGEARRQNLTDR